MEPIAVTGEAEAGASIIGTSAKNDTGGGNVYQIVGGAGGVNPVAAAFPEQTCSKQVRLVATIQNTGGAPATFYLSYQSYDKTMVGIEAPNDARSGQITLNAGVVAVLDTGWITALTPDLIAALVPYVRGALPGVTWLVGGLSVMLR